MEVPRVTSTKYWDRLPRGKLPASPSQIRPEVHAVSDEQSPDSLAELFANRADAGLAAADNAVQADSASAPLVPVQPQFSSRRAMRDAANSSRRPSGRAATQPAAARRPKLSRRDRAAVRKLAATPKIVAAPVAGRSTSASKKRQNPLKVVFVLLVISGFVGGIALPAVASSADTLQAGSATTYKNGQSVKVSASIETAKVSRDAVSATTEDELRSEQLNAAALASASRVRQPGDDYPWRDAGNTLSPLGYYYRQCVDFVAWRLNRDQGVTSAPWKWVWSNLTPNGGDASQWQKAWIAHGWPTSSTPVVGSVAWFVGDHVAYVHSIDGANVTIEEYNGESSRAYAMRTIPISSVGAFLYPPS
jgi:peptidoglycan DL-endopeptidase CwlO